MILPAGNIWETAIQCVCGAITAQEGGQLEIYLSANFGQVTLDPPRVVINPNRLYPIESVIRRSRRFAINVFRRDQRRQAIRLIRIRRREANKFSVLGWAPTTDHHQIPYLNDCLRTIFCEVEQILDTGDHTVMIARVLESRAHTDRQGVMPLLYSEVAGEPSRFPLLRGAFRFLLAACGARDLLIRVLHRRLPVSPPDLAARTYQLGGQTEEEIAEIVHHGLQDLGRVLAPPAAPAVLRRRIAVCVVGTGTWGSYHCRLFRQASPLVDLYVCGREPARLARLARAAGAKDFVIGLERATEDRRFQALSLVLPHDLHREAVERASASQKHVLVEKPIATSLEDADRMIEAARRAGTILMVAEDMHFRPSIREAAGSIARGDVGEPLYLLATGGGVFRPSGWKADRNRSGGGVLLDIGVHYIRALRLLMGEPHRVLAARAMQLNTKMSGEDTVQLLFSSRYGWQAHMLLSWSTPRGHGPDIMVAGEKGTLHLWPGTPYVDLYPATPRPLWRVVSQLRPHRLAQMLLRPAMQRIRQRISGDDIHGYLGEVREFLAAVAEQRPPASAPEEARRDLEIVLHAYQALQRDKWVEIGGPK